MSSHSCQYKLTKRGEDEFALLSSYGVPEATGQLYSEKVSNKNIWVFIYICSFGAQSINSSVKCSPQPECGSFTRVFFPSVRLFFVLEVNLYCSFFKGMTTFGNIVIDQYAHLVYSFPT